MEKNDNIKYLGAQVSKKFFDEVKIGLIRKNLNMRDGIVIALAQYLGIDPTDELKRADTNPFKKQE